MTYIPKPFEKKIVINKAVYQKLEDDMKSFNLYDNRNKNFFYSTLIINTYRYQDNFKKINAYKDILSGNNTSLKNNKLIKALNKDKGKDYDKCLTDIAIELARINPIDISLKSDDTIAIHIRETNKTYGELEQIINESANLSAADIFRFLILDYLSYPLYIREQIIFYDLYLSIKSCMKNKIKCKLETNDTSDTYRIYDIKRGKEEYHSYVIAYRNGKTEPTSFKLSTIKKIIKLKEAFEFTVEEITEINKRLLSGPEWMNGNYTTCNILFDEKGLELYNKRYKDRPVGIFNDNVLTTTCSTTQLIFYIRSFGEHALVLDDNNVKKGLTTFYTNALNKYKG